MTFLSDSFNRLPLSAFQFNKPQVYSPYRRFW